MGHRQNSFSWILSIIVGALVLLSFTIAEGQKSYADAQEYEIKAAFLFNFAKFVEWPEGAFQGPEAPIIISVLGKDPFDRALGSFKGKTINSRSIVIKRVRSLENLEKSHVIFICISERDNLSQILRLAEEWHALTVGDMEGFAKSGGIINLVSVNRKIGFEINVAAAEKSDLKLSSKLLKLSKSIYNN